MLAASLSCFLSASLSLYLVKATGTARPVRSRSRRTHPPAARERPPAQNEPFDFDPERSDGGARARRGEGRWGGRVGRHWGLTV